jgi:NADP-dependent 3-hydroxy acid dehydrogenase YdfG
MTSPKIVLITGASSGIGAATALRLAEAGHHVVLGARRVDRLEAVVEDIRKNGGSADHAHLDVVSLDSFRAFVQGAHERHGRVDVLVGNAGLMPLSPLSALRVDEWNQMFDVHVRGVLNGIAAALPIMKQQGSGHFVTIGSALAHEVMPGTSVYSASKIAAHYLSEGLRKENQDIRATVVSPSWVESELFDSGGDPGTMGWVKGLIENRPLQPPSTIANAVAYAIEQPEDVDINEILVRTVLQAG